jgi:hypothetical protein
MVSGSNDRFLRKEVAIRIAYERMEPNLVWTDFLPAIKEESNAFMFSVDSVGKAADTKKEKPSRYTQGAGFPEIDRSRKVTQAELTKSNGFSMRIGREVIRSMSGVNEINDCYNYAGYWLAEYINASVISALIAGATTPTWTPTAVWSDPTSTPVEDLRLLKYCMRREGYPFRLTDTFVHIDNFREYEGYLTNFPMTAGQQSLFGIPDGSDAIKTPIGAIIRGLDSGITEGYILGVDQNNPAAEIHYYNDLAYTMAEFSYKTMVNGVPTVKPVTNIGIHFKQYEEDDTHDTILQFWVENKTVVTKPYGLLYDSGI